MTLVNFTSGLSTGKPAGDSRGDKVSTCYLVQESVFKQSFGCVFIFDMIRMTYHNMDMAWKCKFHIKLARLNSTQILKRL